MHSAHIACVGLSVYVSVLVCVSVSVLVCVCVIVFEMIRSWSLCVTVCAEMRYCDKCKALKPDRAHHCSVCGRLVNNSLIWFISSSSSCRRGC